MKNKFFSVMAIMFTILISFTNIYAADGLFEMNAYSDIYKLSQQSEIELPFINLFVNAATYDKDVIHSGISIGGTTIDVDKKLEGVHLLFSTDMITINGEVENGVIYGSNVVVKGKITGDTVILASTVQILEDAIVEKDVIIVANSLDIKGTVNGNVIAAVSEMANISGKIGKDLRMVVGKLNLESDEINGEIYIETNSDTSQLKEKFPDATVNSIVEETETQIDWMGIITSGIITVIIYTVICLLITRKENNIAERAYNKFKNNTVFGLLISFVLVLLIIVLPLILILLAAVGLGLIAWPILIAYIALILLVATTASLIVGTTIFEAVKSKVGKCKIPVIVLIFTMLYALTKITMISMYANLAILLIALGIVITMITKKLPKEENKE